LNDPRKSSTPTIFGTPTNHISLLRPSDDPEEALDTVFEEPNITSYPHFQISGRGEWNLINQF